MFIQKSSPLNPHLTPTWSSLRQDVWNYADISGDLVEIRWRLILRILLITKFLQAFRWKWRCAETWSARRATEHRRGCQPPWEIISPNIYKPRRGDTALPGHVSPRAAQQICHPFGVTLCCQQKTGAHAPAYALMPLQGSHPHYEEYVIIVRDRGSSPRWEDQVRDEVTSHYI